MKSDVILCRSSCSQSELVNVFTVMFAYNMYNNKLQFIGLIETIFIYVNQSYQTLTNSCLVAEMYLNENYNC